MSARYFILTGSDDITKHSVKIRDGLNIENYDDCLDNGLYFNTIDRIFKDNCFLEIYIREITLPADDPSVKLNVYQSCYGASKIIAGEKYSLLDPSTYEKIGIEMTVNKRLIDSASAHNNLELLKSLVEKSQEMDFNLEYTEAAIDYASRRGYIDVLDCWLDSELLLKYSESAIDGACGNGYLNVLEWWLNTGIPLKYSSAAIDTASQRGHIKILDYWLNSGLELKYTEHAIDYAHDINVINWWLRPNLKLKYSKNIIDAICGRGDGKMLLEAWFVSGLNIEYSENAMDNASITGRIDILDFWRNSKLDLKYTSKAIDRAKRNPQVIAWWLASGLELKFTDEVFSTSKIEVLELLNKYGILKCTTHAIDRLSDFGDAEVLDWWLANFRSELTYTTEAIDCLSEWCFGTKEYAIKMLDWWKASGLEMTYTNKMMDSASQEGRTDILEWWLGSRLDLKYSHEAFNFSRLPEQEQCRMKEWWAASGLAIIEKN